MKNSFSFCSSHLASVRVSRNPLLSCLNDLYIASSFLVVANSSISAASCFSLSFLNFLIRFLMSVVRYLNISDCLACIDLLSRRELSSSSDFHICFDSVLCFLGIVSCAAV